MTGATRTFIAIIGAGFGGVGLAIRLKKAGIEDFVILERAPGVGGVWRDNTYPGAACDVQSRLYSYSFEQDWEWSSRFAPQPEILAYIEHCATKYGVRPHIRFNTQVEGADFDETNGAWRIRTRGGDTLEARMLVSAVGLFNRAHKPDIPGIEDFRGAMFHSSCWNHDAPIDGKNVAVIGVGASAIQFVPEIAPRAKQLHVVQRSAQYVMPKLRDPKPDERPRLRDTRLGRRLERARIFFTMERGVRRRKSLAMTAASEAAFHTHLAKEVCDETLRARLTPAYRLGCKRVLQSNDWYPALQRPNVELVDARVAEILPYGFRTADGKVREVDTIILNTGFTTTEYIVPMRIAGLGGVDLNDMWDGRPQAYLGMTVKNFPNFFMLYGPNTNGSASIVFLLEAQANYVAKCAKALARSGASWMRLRDEVYESFNERVRERLSRSVIADPSCNTYFKTKSGDIVTQWPGFMSEYRLRTMFPRLSNFAFEKARNA